MPTAACLKVPKKLGEKAIQLTRTLKLFNSQLKVQQLGESLCIPLTANPSPSENEKLREKLGALEFTVREFPEQRRHLTHIDLLANKLPPQLLNVVPRAIDFVGDIAIIEVPLELEPHKKSIGEAILRAHKHVGTVLAKSSAVEGIYRLRKFEVIAGTEKTLTVHREYGCVYHVDIAKAYFSPRLSNEHNRVATQVKEGETVVDLFAGVGPFAIPIAKKHKNVCVYAIDVNPDAVALLRRNVVVNHVEEKVVSIHGDARQVVKQLLSGKADRVIMNLPETALEFVDVACEALKPDGGVIHYYSFAGDADPQKKVAVRLTEAVTRCNRRVKRVLLSKTVREVAPYTWQVVVDAEIQ